jgi:hypothetical protein
VFKRFKIGDRFDWFLTLALFWCYFVFNNLDPVFLNVSLKCRVTGFKAEPAHRAYEAAHVECALKSVSSMDFISVVGMFAVKRAPLLHSER